MPQFKTVGELEFYVNNVVIPNSLANEVFETIKQTEQRHIQSDVYDAYPDPIVYERRKDDSRLIADENIVPTLITNNILSVENKTKPSPNARDGASTDKNLPELIEFGNGYNGNTYDYQYDYPYMDSRPFTQNTIEELKNSHAATDALKAGLNRNGVATV